MAQIYTHPWKHGICLIRLLERRIRAVNAEYRMDRIINATCNANCDVTTMTGTEMFPKFHLS